ncbi:hypothetical protein ACSMX9_01140 [Streptomyces sp. LE64]|uniref:hypothetical protein n=1 Tax=Streptomyces sp. LE64 TaxID=3448653 RepID=UPI0040419868
MGETDPFVCRRLACALDPATDGRAPWGVLVGRRAEVALSYLTPRAWWHTMWRTLANPGE